MSEEEGRRRRSFIRGATGEHAGEFELNLAPVIDCLTVLIVYTMISASFLSLGTFATTVPSEGSSAVSLVPIQVRVDMNPDRTLEMTMSGPEAKTHKIEAKDQDWDFVSMNNTLMELKGKYPTFATVTLAADPQIQYREVVRGIERTKESVPNVVLGE